MTSSISIYDEATLKTLSCALKKAKDEQEIYLKTQIILKICEELIPNKDLPVQICDKISFNLLAFENNFNMNSEEEDFFNVLGATPDILNENKLTVKEQNVLKKEVTKEFKKICIRFNKKYKLLESCKGGLSTYPQSALNYSTFLNNSKADIFKKISEFLSVNEEYSNVLKNTQNSLKKAFEYRESINSLMINYSKCLNEETTLLNINTKIFQHKVINLILSLKNKTFDGLLILLDHLKEKEMKVSVELRRLEKLRNEYEHLNKKEFEAISKRYVFLKGKIVNLEWTIKELLQQ